VTKKTSILPEILDRAQILCVTQNNDTGLSVGHTGRLMEANHLPDILELNGHLFYRAI
jgi:hypothetical protein